VIWQSTQSPRPASAKQTAGRSLDCDRSEKGNGTSTTSPAEGATRKSGTHFLLACISGVAKVRARSVALGRALDRQDGIENRLRELAQIFSVAGGGGSVLDNPLHVRGRLDPQVAAARTFGDLPPVARDGRTIVLARLPLKVIWPIWWAILAALAIGWLAALRGAGRLEPGRGWLGMFALTSIGMLAVTPSAGTITSSGPCRRPCSSPTALGCWPRRRSPRCSAAPSARGLGCHMLLALGLFALVVHDVNVRSKRGT
jgi:hypothetical protein